MNKRSTAAPFAYFSPPPGLSIKETSYPPTKAPRVAHGPDSNTAEPKQRRSLANLDTFESSDTSGDEIPDDAEGNDDGKTRILAALLLDEINPQVCTTSTKRAKQEQGWFTRLKQAVRKSFAWTLTQNELDDKTNKGSGKMFVSKEDLEKSSAPKVPQPKEDVWAKNMQAILDCIEMYDKLYSAAEHVASTHIADSIFQYARWLRRSTHEPHEFMDLLHEWIENQFLHHALMRMSNECSSGSGTLQRFNEEERKKAFSVLKQCLLNVKSTHEALRETMDRLGNSEGKEDSRREVYQ